MDEGVDYAFTSVNERALSAAGKRFVMRYVGPGSAAKHLTAAERDRIWAAQLGIVLLAEGGAQDALGGYNRGVQHGEQASAAAKALGAPLGTPVYFAVDFQVTAAQWHLVAQYLRGCAFGVGTPQVGIYGSYAAVVWAARDKVARWFFQTYAWSGDGHGGHHWFPGNHVEQYHNGVALAGGDVDLCRAKTDYYGQWTPGGDDVNLTDMLSDGKTTVNNALATTNGRAGYLANVFAPAATTALIAQAAKLDALTTAVGQLAAGTFDPAQLTQAVDDAVTAAVKPLHDEIAALKTELDQLRAAGIAAGAALQT